MKQKKFTVYYHVDAVYEAIIPADSLEEALQKAKGMSNAQLHAAPGDVLDENVRITAVLE